MKPDVMQQLAGFENAGYCSCFDSDVKFKAQNSWYRDFYLCPICGSPPRERALMYSIEKFFPQWREMEIHESSPADRGASRRLQKEAKRYIASQFFPGIPSGQRHQGFRCENLEAMSFADSSIDLHITQDVFEHIFNPVASFREIARTLRPGGAHVFTVPLVNKNNPTRQCATMDAHGHVTHLVEKPEFHGNPVDANGSLVTWNWGYDITQCIFQACGLQTEMVYLDALELGIRAEYIEVLITRKPSDPASPSAWYSLLPQNIDSLFGGRATPALDTILKAVDSACRSDHPRVAFASLLTLADILIGNGRGPIARFVLDGALRFANEWNDPDALRQVRLLEKKINGHGTDEDRPRPLVTVSEAALLPMEIQAAETLRRLAESAGGLKAQGKLSGRADEAALVSSTVSGKVDIVIPVYGQAPLVQRCVESVLRTVPSGKVILVDDCSPDAGIRALFAGWKANPRLTLVTTPSNLGFLGASRLGASLGQAPFILFLNSDTEALEPGWLERLIPMDETVAVTGAKLLYPPDAPAPLAGSIQHAGIARNRIGVPYHPFLGLPADAAEADRAREVNAVTGACFLVRRAVWQELGGWDAAFGRGVYEDVDFCWRARKRGYRVQYIPAARLYHRESASVAPDGQHTLNQHTEENRRTLLERWPAQASDEAIFFGEKVTQRWDKARALVQAAQPALAKSDFKVGLAGLRKAVELASDWSEVLLGYAQALAASGDHLHAVDYFRKTLQLAPTLWDVRLALADELTLLNEVAQAREELVILRRVFPAHPKVRKRWEALPGGAEEQAVAIAFPPCPETASQTLEMLLAQEDLPAALVRYADRLNEPLLILVRQSAREARQKNLSDLAEGLENLAAYIARVIANRPAASSHAPHSRIDPVASAVAMDIPGRKAQTDDALRAGKPSAVPSAASGKRKRK